MNNIQYLTKEIEKLAPIDGVSVGSWQDKDTWRVDYKTSATNTQKQAVNAFIDAFDPTTPTPDDVRAEAGRRMIALIGARDATDLAIKIQNGLRESARLLEKQVSGQTLTATETTRKQTLQQLDAAIEAIRAASNALEVMKPIPVNYQDNSWWP